MELKEDELRADVHKYFTNVAVAFATEAADQATEWAKQAINEFYKNYTPKKYGRTYDLRDNSYSRYYRNHGDRVVGGVVISSNKMSDYMNGRQRVDPYEIAESAWVGGMHGHIRPAQIDFPSPYSKVETSMKDARFRKRLMKKAEKEARQQTYTFLSF